MYSKNIDSFYFHDTLKRSKIRVSTLENSFNKLLLLDPAGGVKIVRLSNAGENEFTITARYY